MLDRKYHRELEKQRFQYMVKLRVERIRYIIARGDYTEQMIKLQKELFEANLERHRETFGQDEVDKLITSLKGAPLNRDLFT